MRQWKLTLSWLNLRQMMFFRLTVATEHVAMIVLDHSEYAWFLLEHEGGLFLDAYCSFSFLDYSVLIAMNKAEETAYRTKSRSYLDQMAYDINSSAPAARGSNSQYVNRNLTNKLGDLMSAAIAEWRAKLPSP